jgi:DNA-binding CsgD family transcriptional regulator
MKGTMGSQIPPGAPSDALFIGIWDWDTLSDRLVSCPYVARLFGVSPQRARTGATIAEFITQVSPHDRRGLEENLAAVLRAGGEFTASYSIVRQSGPSMPVIARGRYDLERGRFTGAMLTICNSVIEFAYSSHWTRDTKARLAHRELQTLEWCSRGKTNWEIGQILNISERTVEHHIASAVRKLNCATRAQAVAQAVRERLIL